MGIFQSFSGYRMVSLCESSRQCDFQTILLWANLPPAFDLSLLLVGGYKLGLYWRQELSQMVADSSLTSSYYLSSLVECQHSSVPVLGYPLKCRLALHCYLLQNLAEGQALAGFRCEQYKVLWILCNQPCKSKELLIVILPPPVSNWKRGNQRADHMRATIYRIVWRAYLSR